MKTSTCDWPHSTMRRSKMSVSLAALLFTIPCLGIVSRAQDCSKWATDFRQTVVSLSVEKTRKETGAVTVGTGTGFIVSKEGHVMTAYHVVAEDPDTDDIKIDGAIGSLFGPKLPMTVLFVDKTKDIALLAFKNDSPTYRPMVLGDAFKVTIGSQLCSLSFSAPINEDFHITIGALSTKTGEDKKNKVKNLWTTQMPSNFGESGAPVIDLTNGGAVAIKYGGRDPSVTQNVNYLIPMNLAKSILLEYANVKVPTETVTTNSEVANEASLQSIRVTFVMPPGLSGNDKDFDTRISVSIAKANITLASEDNLAPGIQFVPPGNYGPFNVGVAQTPIPKSVYKDSVVTLGITPTGHDKWVTGLIIEATFSDNQVVKTQFGPVILDQDLRVTSFQNP